MPEAGSWLVLQSARRGFGYTPPAAPGPVETLYGFNTDDVATLDSRTSRFDGRAPLVRRYSEGYLFSGSFSVTEEVAPERRAVYSFTTSAPPLDAAGLAAGNGNSWLKSWIESIPPNWTVYLHYMPQANTLLATGQMTPLQYKTAYAQFYSVIQAARGAGTLAENTTVKLCANFLADYLSVPGNFDVTWLPDADSMDLLTFDLFGNPGQFTPTSGSNVYGTATGSDYGSQYPLPLYRFQDMFDAIALSGWQTKWGLLALNTPPRDWDGPINPDFDAAGSGYQLYQGTATGTEAGRAAWLTDAINFCAEPPMPHGSGPEVLLFWEHPQATDWNQKFFTSNTWNAVKPFILSTPDGSP